MAVEDHADEEWSRSGSYLRSSPLHSRMVCTYGVPTDVAEGTSSQTETHEHAPSGRASP
jgi:hypothetical protein